MGDRIIQHITGAGDAVIVFDRGPYRALRMASDPALVQGYRHRFNPYDYRSEYIHAHLAASLMGHGTPQTVLCLGLGVGAIPSLLSTIYPGLRIIAVELNDTVVEAGRQHFGLNDIPGLELKIQCASEFIAENQRRYDQVFVDCYDALGIPDLCSTSVFFDAVMNALEPQGLLVANLLPNRRGSERVYAGWTERLDAWCIPGRLKSNHTVYGSPGSLCEPVTVIDRWKNRPLGPLPGRVFDCLARAQPASAFRSRFQEP